MSRYTFATPPSRSPSRPQISCKMRRQTVDDCSRYSKRETTGALHRLIFATPLQSVTSKDETVIRHRCSTHCQVHNCHRYFSVEVGRGSTDPFRTSICESFRLYSLDEFAAVLHIVSSCFRYSRSTGSKRIQTYLSLDKRKKAVDENVQNEYPNNRN